MNDGLGQEWMKMIVVDDFTALNNAKSRAELRVDSPAGMGCLDGNRVCAVISGKSAALGRCDANLPIMLKICRILSRRTFRDIAFRSTYTHYFRSPSGKEGHKERKYEHKEFHAVQRYEKK